MQFAMITEAELIKLNKLSHADAMVFTAAKMYSDYSQGIYKSGYGLIASVTGMQKPHISRTFRRLEDAGLVKCVSNFDDDKRRKEWKIVSDPNEELVITDDYHSTKVVTNGGNHIDEIVTNGGNSYQNIVTNNGNQIPEVVTSGGNQLEDSYQCRQQIVTNAGNPIQKAEYKTASRLDYLKLKELEHVLVSLAPNQSTRQQVYDVLESNASVNDENVVSFVKQKMNRAKSLKGLLLFLADTPDKPLPKVEPFVYTPTEKAPKEVIDECMQKVRERLQAKQMA